jgi:hypothetical protein
MDEAIRLDRDERIVDAAAAYEGLLAAGSTALEVYLHLILLYFAASDFGYSAHHHLPLDFGVRADEERMFQLLDEAQRHHPQDPDLEFWRLFIPWAYLSEPFPREIAMALPIRTPAAMAVARVIWSDEPMSVPTEELRGLLDLLEADGTIGVGYSISVVRANLEQREFQEMFDRKAAERAARATEPKGPIG